MINKLISYLLIFCLSSSTPFGAVYALDIELPELGSASDSVMTPTQELRFGQAFYRSVRASGNVMDEPWVSQYINSLGHRLTQSSDGAGEHFFFFVIDEPNINAFAGPAGYIGIHSGLITAAQTESELAAVMAHEIAHVTQNHLARFFHDASRLNSVNAALVVAAIVLGAAVGGDAGIAALLGAQGSMIQHQIDFTRANEKEADNIGMDILSSSNFDPSDMGVFFSRMGKASRTYNTNIPEFLLTHPVTTSRIAESEARAAEYPYKQVKSDPEFFLIKSWLRAQSIHFTSKETVAAFEKNISDKRYTSLDSEKFGLAHAFLRDKQTQKAILILEKLYNKNPKVSAYTVSLADAYLANKQANKAVTLLTDNQNNHAKAGVVQIKLAEMLAADKQTNKAINLLDQLLDEYPTNAFLWKLAAQTYNDNNDKTNAYRKMAEYHFLNGNMELAIQQLERLLQRPNVDYITKEQVQARLAIFQQNKKIKEKDKT